jgi:hypothetical protein
MKTQELPAVQISARVVIRPGDKVRARGGPTYGGTPIGNPGVYLVDRIFQRGRRVFIAARRVDRETGIPCGAHNLYVQGKPYVSKLVATILERPYRLSKVRR